MFRSLKTIRSKRQCVQLLCILAGWPVLSFSLSFFITPSAHAAAGQEQAALQSESAGAQARHGPPTPRGYRIINVIDGKNIRATNFNARDQIGVSFYTGNFNDDQIFFLDGKSIRDIGNIGGSGANVSGINDAGELAGGINTGGDQGFHAFRWNARDGLRDLGSDRDDSDAGQTQPINNRGQVVGVVSNQAALWSPGDPIGFPTGLPGNPYRYSRADAINNTGVIGGRGTVADGTTQAFAWTRRSGYIDVSPAGAASSGVVGLTDDGLAVGNARDANGKLFGFSWTHKAGARRLATGGFAESIVNGAALLSRGNVAGSVRSGEVTHAAVWIGGAPDALVDLGTFGGPSSLATGVNNRAHVVGVADYTAGKRTSFIWTRKEGKVDLNKRIRYVPPGLTITYPYAISETGTILADSSAGLVLLKPEEECAGLQTPTVGAINAVDMVEVGAVFDVSVGFAGPAVGSGSASGSSARHDVKWSFGDGQQSQWGSVRESRGAGQAGATHRYTAPGIYTVSAQVHGSSGPGPTVRRTIVAYDRASGSVAGNGWFASPAGADRTQSLQGDPAHFTFAASGVDGKPAALHFKVGTLDFRSNAVATVRTGRGEARLDGTGKLNGAGTYRFSLRASRSQDGNESASSRVGLKIWHTDQATNAEAIDYDNLDTGASSVVPAAQGKVVLQ